MTKKALKSSKSDNETARDPLMHPLKLSTFFHPCQCIPRRVVPMHGVRVAFGARNRFTCFCLMGSKVEQVEQGSPRKRKRNPDEVQHSI